MSDPLNQSEYQSLRHSLDKVFEQEWSHHHDHTAGIAELSGWRSGVEARLARLEAQIDSLQLWLLSQSRNLSTPGTEQEKQDSMS
jgi:hypothetical protein